VTVDLRAWLIGMDGRHYRRVVRARDRKAKRQKRDSRKDTHANSP